MKSLLSLVLIIISFSVQGTENSPPDFAHKGQNAVFVDFRQAYYQMIFDFKAKSSIVTSTIEFYQDKPGYPIFDLRNKVIDIQIDGQKTFAAEATPPGSETRVLVLGTLLQQGKHKLVVKNNIADFHGPIFQKKSYLDFFMRLDDLDDRLFLEIYVPSSFEYDKVNMVFDIQIMNTPVSHIVYNNGDLKELAPNHFRIKFPEYFNTSSPFIHILKKGLYPEVNFEIKSVSGKKIPVKIYSDKLAIANKAKKETLAVIAELEALVGPWPHPALLINVYEGGAGMEFAGALVGGDEAIRHEIIHSYFARAVMPLDGRSAWIDESLTTWMENGYRASDSFAVYEDGSVFSPRVNQLPPYKRHTNHTDYDGEYYFAYLNLKLSAQGGLQRFLPYFFLKYKFQFVTTEILKEELESFYGIDLTEDFETYIY